MNRREPITSARFAAEILNDAELSPGALVDVETHAL
jgi:hypothetical protein